MGLAPTLPGIKLIFSIPPKPFSTAQRTNSCQFSPDPILTKTESAVSSKIVFPKISFRRTIPLKSAVNNKLLPPPIIKKGRSFVSLKSMDNSSVEENREK